MTLDEKIGLVHGLGRGGATAQDPAFLVVAERSNGGAGFVPGVPRLGLPDLQTMVKALEINSNDSWAQRTLGALRQPSPVMLQVSLEQIRRARYIGLADDLRMERDMMRHCFALRTRSEAFEGIRARVVDKDNSPRWNPPRIENVTNERVQAFFVSPWPAHAHPLRLLD